MQTAAPTRAIAVATLPAEMQAAVGTSPGGFPFGITIPQFFQPTVSFQANTAGQAGRSVGAGSRSGVCASRHMAAEQRRRARINERLEALRGLVPHSARANTAAFLTEVFEYITALHKQLDRLGGGVIDLNVAASDGKDKESNQALKGAVKTSLSRKRSRDSKSDEESEVESEDPGSSEDYSHQEMEHKPPYSTVSAPSLFDSATKNAEETVTRDSVPSFPQLKSKILEVGNRSAFSPAAVSVNAAVPDVSLAVGLGFPEASSHPSKNFTSEPCSTHMSLSIGPSQTQSTKIEPRNIQPAPVPLMPGMHPNAVVAAAAAVADAAAAAQSWGMAAVVAQAQAQVAAQVHAQAQAQAHAMVQAHAQVHAQTQVQQARNISVMPKKRRRGIGADTCSMRHRSMQGVVRPIALKPQR